MMRHLVILDTFDQIHTMCTFHYICKLTLHIQKVCITFISLLSFFLSFFLSFYIWTFAEIERNEVYSRKKPL